MARHQEPADESASSRRDFLLGAIAGATVGLATGPREADAQAVGVWHPPAPKGAPKPKAAPPRFATAVVNESVSALDEWQSPNARLVRRISFGVTALEMLRVNQMGYQEYLNRQLHPEWIDDSACEATVAARWPLLKATTDVLATANSGVAQAQLQESTIFRAAFSERQLYERMVEFWNDHFNIAISKVSYLKVVDDRNVIRANALGKFRDLVRASAKSPAMLAYLDQNQSRRGAPNENYARELMELHTVGVDGGYTQTDVSELARVLTGWTTTGTGTFVFNSGLHDYGAKTVMGVTIPAASSATGTAAVAEGELMVDFLANHPNTAKFISTKLLRWLLRADPTASQIASVTRVFRATGGDIRLVVRAILNSGWLAVAPTKYKRPFHFLVSALRATSMTVTSASGLNGNLNTIGQPLFLWDTPDGYPDTVEYWSGNIMPRWSLATTLGNANSNTTIKLDTSRYLAGSPDAAVDTIIMEFFGGEVAAAQRNALLAYIKGGTFTDARVRETIALALSSQAFQWY